MNFKEEIQGNSDKESPRLPFSFQVGLRVGQHGSWAEK